MHCQKHQKDLNFSHNNFSHTFILTGDLRFIQITFDIFNMNYWVQLEKNKHEIGRPASLQLVKKETPTQVLSCGICETFKNTGGCF